MVYNNQIYSSVKPQNAVITTTNISSKQSGFFEKIRGFFEAIASFFCCHADRKSNKKFEAENLTPELQKIFEPLQQRNINAPRKFSEAQIKQFSKQLSESIQVIETNFKNPEDVKKFIKKNGGNPVSIDDQELCLIPAGSVPGIDMRFFLSPATGDIFIPFKKNAHFQYKIPFVGAGSFKKVRLAWDVKNKQVVVLWRMLLKDNNAHVVLIEQKFAQIFKGNANIAQSNYLVFYKNKKGKDVAAGVSPYYPHGDLLTLSQSRLLPSQEHQLWLQILTGLKTVHSKGVVHRDIKPDNIFIGDNYHAKIADFGLAEEVSKLGLDGPGTPEYYPPEVIESLNWKVANPQLGDNYALGITILVYYLAKSNNQKAREKWDNCRQRVFTNIHTLDKAESKEKIKNKDEDIIAILNILITNIAIPEHMITLIKGLTKINPAERMTLDQALEIMEKVNYSN